MVFYYNRLKHKCGLESVYKTTNCDRHLTLSLNNPSIPWFSYLKSSVISKPNNESIRKKHCRLISLMNRDKHSWQNTGKTNFKAHEVNYMAWSSEISLRDARIVQYRHINSCDMSLAEWRVKNHMIILTHKGEGPNSYIPFHNEKYSTIEV